MKAGEGAATHLTAYSLHVSVCEQPLRGYCMLGSGSFIYDLHKHSTRGCTGLCLNNEVLSQSKPRCGYATVKFHIRDQSRAYSLVQLLLMLLLFT